MICPQCGKESKPGSLFCSNCGSLIQANTAQTTQTVQADVTPEQTAQFGQNTAVNAAAGSSYGTTDTAATKTVKYAADYDLPKINKVLVDDDETVMATLKNGEILNYLSKEGLLRERAFVTNKRLYYNGKKGSLSVEAKLDVEEVTGTKILSVTRYEFILMMILFAIVAIIIKNDVRGEEGEVFMYLFIVAAIISLLAFIFTKKKCLRVEYAGGHIDFSLLGYTMKNVRSFQNTILKAKAAITGKK